MQHQTTYLLNRHLLRMPSLHDRKIFHSVQHMQCACSTAQLSWLCFAFAATTTYVSERAPSKGLVTSLPSTLY